MHRLAPRSAAGIALLGAAILLSACGDREGTAATNNAAAPVPGANSFAIGNDASAMESVGSAPAAGGGQVLPMNDMVAPSPSTNGTTGNSAAPLPDSGASSGSAPGGDRGGNTVESNVSGM